MWGSCLQMLAHPVFHDSGFGPFGHLPEQSFVTDEVLGEAQHPVVVDGIEATTDIGVEHPGDPLFHEIQVKGIKGTVLDLFEHMTMAG